jgi:hypothetical protein
MFQMQLPKDECSIERGNQCNEEAGPIFVEKEHKQGKINFYLKYPFDKP